MAFLIEKYYERREAFRSQVAENSLPPDDLVLVQELDYRISILETFQTFCKAAPLTADTKVLVNHYQLVNLSICNLLTERKFGTKTDDNGKKKRETAALSLDKVVKDNQKRFASFAAQTQNQYKTSITNYINAVLPVWVQYRDTYVKL